MSWSVYKVYWIDEDGYRGYTYVEAPSTKEARKWFTEQYGGTIIRVVKDC